MFKKTMRIILIITAITALFSIDVTASNFISSNKFIYTIEENVKNTSENNTKISGVLPVISGSSDMSDKINSRINEIYNEKIKSAASSRAKEIVFSYNKYESNNYLSIVITNKIINATEKNEVTTITVDLVNNKIIDLAEYANKNNISIDIIDKYVAHYKSNSSANFNQSFGNITQNSSFYINSAGKLFLAFNIGEFRLDAKNYDNLLIPYPDFEKYILKGSEYYFSDSFNTKMIPLRKISEFFDYKVEWNSSTKNIEVIGNDTTSTINNNSYVYSLNKKTVILENKPENIDGTTYVPLSYFSDALGIPYYILENGIVFYKF